MRHQAQLSAAALVAAIAVPSTLAGPISFRTIATSGMTAPGTGGARFATFNRPVINSNGKVAFEASLELGFGGVDLTNSTGIWSNAEGPMRLFVREHSAAPGTSGALFDGFVDPLFNQTGTIAFRAVLELGTGGVSLDNDSGVWVGPRNGLSLAGREDDPAPDVGGAAFFGLDAAALSNTGGLLIRGSLHTDASHGVTLANDEGLWLGQGNAIDLFVRESDFAPGTIGATFDNILNGSNLNAQGELVFVAGLDLGQGGVDSTNDSGIWSTYGGGLSLVLQGNELALGTGGVRFDQFRPPVMNDSGMLAFAATLHTGVNGTTIANDSGIWTIENGIQQLWAREGRNAPGLGGADFDVLFDPSINAAGEIAFNATLQNGEFGIDSTNDSGIWASLNGALRLISREGSDAPGTGGADFGPAEGHNILFNNSGDLAFWSFLQTGENGVTSANDTGIWAYCSALDQLMLVAREGELFDINDDPNIEELKTISKLALWEGSWNFEERRVSLNDAGQLAFQLEFTDGSQGIFMATIPAPGSAVGAIVAAAAWLPRRRRVSRT